MVVYRNGSCLKQFIVTSVTAWVVLKLMKCVSNSVACSDSPFRQPRKHSLIKGGLDSCLGEPQNIIWYNFEERPAVLALW